MRILLIVFPDCISQHLENPTWLKSHGDFHITDLTRIDVLRSISFLVMTNCTGLSHMTKMYTKMYTETSDVITTYSSDISTRGKVLT